MRKTNFTRIGETNTMSCGLKATITAYHNNVDIDVKFENGSIRTGVRYDKFKVGAVSPQKQHRQRNK